MAETPQHDGTGPATSHGAVPGGEYYDSSKTSTMSRNIKSWGKGSMASIMRMMKRWHKTSKRSLAISMKGGAVAKKSSKSKSSKKMSKKSGKSLSKKSCKGKSSAFGPSRLTPSITLQVQPVSRLLMMTKEVSLLETFRAAFLSSQLMICFKSLEVVNQELLSNQRLLQKAVGPRALYHDKILTVTISVVVNNETYSGSADKLENDLITTINQQATSFASNLQRLGAIFRDWGNLFSTSF